MKVVRGGEGCTTAATGWHVIARWEADAVPHREFIVSVGERKEGFFRTGC